MIDTMKQFETFSRSLKYYGINFERKEVNSLQLNLGNNISQSCIESMRPDNNEMLHNTIFRTLDLLKENNGIKTVYISVNDSKLNQDVKYLIQCLEKLEIKVIHKYNINHITNENYNNTVNFLADHKIHIIISIPDYYIFDKVDYFKDEYLKEDDSEEDDSKDDTYYTKVVDVMKYLNKLGYGKIGSELELNLEIFPTSFKLLGDLDQLESEYKKRLKQVYGIDCNHIFVKANMPINQYAHELMDKGEFTNYCNLLFSAFDCSKAEKIDCNHQISINWKGELFDCEHNLSMEIPVCSVKNTIWDINNFHEVTQEITFARHCYGCTAKCDRH